ncbi:hypothetical protein ACWGIN_21445 [Streptomyces sp. NPDC054861]
MVRRRLRLAAVLTVVVLALTGFQTSAHAGKSSGKGRGGSSSSGGGSGDSGGGCSSSKKKNDDYDGSGDSGGDTSTYEPTPTVTASASSTSAVEVVVVDCVEPARKKRKGKPARKADTTATVRITSRETFTETFDVELGFVDAGGAEVDDADTRVTVEPGETKTFEVAMDTPKAVDKVRSCVVGSVREQ